MIAMAATLSPWASAMAILITGSLNVTELATSVPAILLIKSPSMSGMRAWTMPSMSVGAARNISVREVGPFKMKSRRCSVD